jgi:hypothetical protein
MGILELVGYTWTGGRRFREATNPAYERQGRTCERGKGNMVTHAVLFESQKKKTVYVLFRDAEFNLWVTPHEQRIERQHVVCQVQYSLQNNSYFILLLAGYSRNRITFSSSSFLCMLVHNHTCGCSRTKTHFRVL